MKVRRPRKSMLCMLAGLLLAASLSVSQSSAFPHKVTTNSPLTSAQQSALDRAGRAARSGHFKQAVPMFDSVVDGATDVPKCIAIADYTDQWATPLLEVRRNAMNKAYSLAQTREDMILVALKSRQYQYFEITRKAVDHLVAGAKSLDELYDLATKCHEVALNDVCHRALERAYISIQSEPRVFQFCETAKALGTEDLLRKAVKDLYDDQGDVSKLCDYIYKCSQYNMRDLSRYGLRKAMDNATTIPEMQQIYETAVRLNEPDVANRANYFVRKGKVIEKIKEDRATYDARMRAYQQGLDPNTVQPVGSGATSGGQQQNSGF